MEEGNAINPSALELNTRISNQMYSNARKVSTLPPLSGPFRESRKSETEPHG